MLGSAISGLGAVDPSSASLDALSRYLLGKETVAGTLRRVAALTVDALPPARFAGISMLVDDEPRTAIYTDERAPQVDSAQYEHGLGPCLDSYRDGVVNRIDDTELDTRWPAFAKVAAAEGIRSTISFPMIAGEARTGALNLYALEQGGFTGVDEELGLRLASHAATVLLNSRVFWDSQELIENLEQAMRSRATIEQAKGALMAQSNCGPQEAFEMLVRASQRQNIKLRDVAAQIVTGLGDC